MAREGKAINMPKHIITARRNGHTPLNINSMGISGATPLMTNTFIPTGGVITPIATTKTIMTPNQIGS